MQVEDVETARSVNVRVASRVMGWTQWVDLLEGCPDEPGVTYFADWGDGCGLSVYLPDGDGDVAFYFDPAGDLKDAWQLVERFAAETDSRKRYWFTVRLRWAIEDRIETHCLESEMILRVKPVDICHAALMSVERDK